jgi:hypothetical protein
MALYLATQLAQDCCFDFLAYNISGVINATVGIKNEFQAKQLPLRMITLVIKVP